MSRGKRRVVGAVALAALAVAFLGCMSLSVGDAEKVVIEKRPATTEGDDGVLQQRGSLPALRPGVEQKVYYPVPYASPPNLQISHDHYFVVVEQQADHFVVRQADDVKSVDLHFEVPAWVARGVRRAPTPEPAKPPESVQPPPLPDPPRPIEKPNGRRPGGPPRRPSPSPQAPLTP